MGWSRNGAGGIDRSGSNDNAVAMTMTLSETVYLTAAGPSEHSTQQGLWREKREEKMFLLVNICCGEKLIPHD